MLSFTTAVHHYILPSLHHQLSVRADCRRVFRRHCILMCRWYWRKSGHHTYMSRIPVFTDMQQKPVPPTNCICVWWRCDYSQWWFYHHP